ncbi:transglycosylase domain-containing protein [Tenacibaculum dicentrarchi]|nr:transglycosylase domain-containing protein [Tenacibaculum dicentrarchi]
MKKYIIAFIFSIPILLFVYLENSIDLVIEKDNKDYLFNSIEKTEPLPLAFKQTIEKYNPNFFEQGVWNSIFGQLIGKARNGCQCREIYYPFLAKDKKFTPEILALELEDKFTQKKCYEYNMNTANFGYGIIGIRNASRKFYNKEINDLTENEILKLNIKKENPSLYKDEIKLDEILLKLYNLGTIKESSNISNSKESG